MSESDPVRAAWWRRGRVSVPLGLAFVAMFASAPGQSFLIAVFLEDMVRDTGVSRTSFSLLYGVATIVSATTSLWLGRGADRFGIRLAWVLVAAGLALACLLASLAAGAVSVLAALALLRAFGQGSFPLLGTLIANYWFRARPGAAMSVARFGLPAATILLPPLLAILIEDVGWRAAYRVVAAVVLLAILPLAALVGRPPIHARPAGDVVSVPAAPAIPASRPLSGVTTGIVWSRTYGLARLGRLQEVSFAAQITAAAAGPLPLALSVETTGSYTTGLVLLLAVAATTLAAATRWRNPVAPTPAPS